MRAKFITSWTILIFFLLGGYSHYTSLFEFKRKLLENSMESDI